MANEELIGFHPSHFRNPILEDGHMPVWVQIKNLYAPDMVAFFQSWCFPYKETLLGLKDPPENPQRRRGKGKKNGIRE